MEVLTKKGGDARIVTLDTSYFTFIATQAALRAGEILKKGFSSPFTTSSKPGMQNLVTEYDILSEKSICQFVHEHFPDHNFLGEESGATTHTRTKSVLWIIDPLDGTVNFAHRVPVFSVSIGVCVEEEILSGVVFQPMTGELFVAEKNKGAYLNGSKIQVSSTSHLNDALIATGFPYNLNENPKGCIDKHSSLLKHGYAMRRLGSAALDLSYLAAGRFDAYFEVSLQPWDMAAGKLIAEEAGALVTTYSGEKKSVFDTGPLLASNRILHSKMQQLLS